MITKADKGNMVVIIKTKQKNYSQKANEFFIVNNTGLPKIHKKNTTIRPLINYTTAPGHRTANKLEQVIKNNIPLKITTVSSSIDFVKKRTFGYLSQVQLISFDILNLYINVPVQNTLDILREN